MAKNDPRVIGDFRKRHAFLSNFYRSPMLFLGLRYMTAEHVYQAAKTLVPLERRAIRVSATPGEAKRLGNRARLRPGWDGMKYDVMMQIVRAKFMQHQVLAEHLVDTGRAELVEINTWNDTIWGVCNGEGQNWLGKILMCVRNELHSIGIVEGD